YISSDSVIIYLEVMDMLIEHNIHSIMDDFEHIRISERSYDLYSKSLLYEIYRSIHNDLRLCYIKDYNKNIILHKWSAFVKSHYVYHRLYYPAYYSSINDTMMGQDCRWYNNGENITDDVRKYLEENGIQDIWNI